MMTTRPTGTLDTCRWSGLRFPPMTTTHAQLAATMLLGQPVSGWIVARRTDGLSWRKIALALRDATGGQVDVTHETVRAWADDDAAEQVPA